VLNNTLLPSAYFAPIKYYGILTQKKNCLIEIHENFKKQSIRNRCYIYHANGKKNLSIPKVRKKSSKTNIKDIKISYTENWQKTHWNSIISAYNSSPFFEFYKDEISNIFFKKETYLLDFNNNLQDIILSFISKEVKYSFSKSYNKNGRFYDLRISNFKLINQKKYPQVFMDKYGFIENLSIIDLLFNLGPETKDYLSEIDLSFGV
jgi:hypothetical protein